MARRIVRLLLALLLVLLLVPGWSGSERLPLLDRDAKLRATRLAVPPGTQFGALALVGAIRLRSEAPAFGGFSAIALRGGRITLLNDGGNWIAFALRGGRPVEARGGYLPDGPGTGWEKRDRDSESLVLDAATGRAWIAFENGNSIWRFAPGFTRAERFVRPEAMRRWPPNGGAEAMTRLADGRFVVIGERAAKRRLPKPGLIFAGDPTTAPPPERFLYRPPPGFDPSDAAVLPNGDLLVLNRRFRMPFRFDATLVRVPAATIRPGATVHGRIIARLGAPAFAENWEGVTVTREGDATMLWLVSDEDMGLFQRTLVAKFRLVE